MVCIKRIAIKMEDQKHASLVFSYFPYEVAQT